MNTARHGRSAFGTLVMITNSFDPAVGKRMEARGFNREHCTGETFRTAIAPDDAASSKDASALCVAPET
jgi:hypothetical protein